jgi:orotidine-5'-phosphate decarboxylase
MTYSQKLRQRIAHTGAGLCVGLDPRPDLIQGDVESWLRRVIDETAPCAACFKPNSAYFEALGASGFRLLEKLRGMIPGEIPLLLDAKRSDIGETQRYYARAAFEIIGADAITLNPFLGFDSIEPFLEWTGKGVYLLAVTSNAGAADIELQPLADSRCVFELVLDMHGKASGAAADVGFVIGLTNAAADILAKVPDAPLLIPGLGAQGGEISALRGQKRQAPVLVNVSRGILYAAPEKSFAEKARQFHSQLAGLAV